MFSNQQFFSCIGRNKSKDPIFDFSRLWLLIVGIYAAWVLRLAFNLQNYACKCFYLFSHILSLSCHSLQHSSRVEAAAAAHRPPRRSGSPPILTAQARSIGSSLFLANFPILLLSVLPLLLCCTRRCARARSWRGSARVPCAALHHAHAFPARRFPARCRTAPV